jgi:cytoskeletal protein RodZ
MKKAISILLVSALLLFSVGCGRTEDVPEKDAEVSEEATEAEMETETEAEMETETKSETEASEALETETPEDASEIDDSAVVVKSSNAVSSEEKEAVLVELEKELDDVLESINQLETVEDSDLVIE